MKNDNNTYDIFLSYRRVGGFETAKHLFDLLVRDGYRVSFDIDTLRSGDFDIQLLHRIDQCTDFILILNAGAFDRSIDPASDRNKDWMRIELAYALEKKKNIIPIMLNGFTDFPDNLPDDIAAVERKNGPKYDSYYFDAFYHKLLRFLESEPIINTTTNKNDWDNSNDDSLLKIRTDLACRVLIDGEERATAHPDKITRIPLRGGSYQLQFVSLENEADKITIDTYRIEKDIEELYTVSLLPVKQTRKEKEERAIRREKEEEERHHDLQQQGQRCPAAGPLPGQFGSQRPHTGLLRKTGDARLMDGGRVRHQRRRGVPCNRRGTVAPGFAQRGHSPGRAARGRLRHGRGHQEPGHDTEAVGLVGKRPVSDAIYLGTDACHLLRKHHRQRLLRGTGRGHGRPLGHREHSRQ